MLTDRLPFLVSYQRCKKPFCCAKQSNSPTRRRWPCLKEERASHRSTSRRYRTTSAKCSRNKASAGARRSIRTSTARATRRTSAPRMECGWRSNKRRRAARCAPGAAQSSRRVVEWLRVLTGRQCCREQRLGTSTDKIDTLSDYAKSPLFSDAEKVALEYADAITVTDRDVDDELFARLQQHYDDDTIAELTMIIAWENASSRFNRAFRIPSQGFWKR